MNNGGGKSRFRILFPEDARGNLLHFEVGTPALWKHFVTPLDIKCIQGGSGNRDTDIKDCFPVPEDTGELFHATYYRCLKTILKSGGLYCGGLSGETFRNRIYVSCKDWVQYPKDYVAPQEPFTCFRYEPYPPRADWQVQVKLCRKTCRELGGKFL